jgi:hypothetical protein
MPRRLAPCSMTRSPPSAWWRLASSSGIRASPDHPSVRRLPFLPERIDRVGHGYRLLLPEAIPHDGVLRRLVDSAVPSPMSLPFANDTLGPEALLFGTNLPLANRADLSAARDLASSPASRRLTLTGCCPATAGGSPSWAGLAASCCAVDRSGRPYRHDVRVRPAWMPNLALPTPWREGDRCTVGCP